MTALRPEEVVKRFFDEVRSGKKLAAAPELMAGKVFAHQVQSEQEVTVERTPEVYAEHVQEMLDAYGPFALEVQELLGSGDRVYVRWKQTGTHISEVDGYPPTGLPVIELASAVYRVENGKIAEYWIQIDRAGIERQLKRNAAEAEAAIVTADGAAD
ncbi:ester cyclase [Paenibacillus chitinolyticus]|uniref:ester cyclase n=1 Tax=Paenibacillus chitinolyticus TaxID=79263 RepID=UPI0036DD293C